MKLQEQHDAKRKQYMDGKLSHEDFYCWLADSIKITKDNLPVTLNRVRESADPHLNDISLYLWDRKDQIVRYKAVQAGMRAWSLSDTVCVLKNFAKREAKAKVQS